MPEECVLSKSLGQASLWKWGIPYFLVVGWEPQTCSACSSPPQRIPVRAVLCSHLMLYSPPVVSHSSLYTGQRMTDFTGTVLKMCLKLAHVECLFKSIKCQCKNKDHRLFIHPPHAPPLPCTQVNDERRREWLAQDGSLFSQPTAAFDLRVRVARRTSALRCSPTHPGRREETESQI